MVMLRSVFNASDSDSVMEEGGAPAGGNVAGVDGEVGKTE